MKRSFLAALAAACACGDARPVALSGTPDATCPTDIQSTFTSIDQKVFQPVCTGCHQASTAASFGHLDLSGDAYAQLVNVPALNEAATTPPPGLLRVKPGDPDHSLLWLKLVTRSTQDPRYGSGMPQDRPGTLCATVTDAVRAWIAGGAPRD
jgi:hypothetical protein